MAVTGGVTDTRRRVKVYSFNEKMQWEDMGTGHVAVNYVERLQSLIITVRSEDDCKLLGFCWTDCIQLSSSNSRPATPPHTSLHTHPLTI